MPSPEQEPVSVSYDWLEEADPQPGLAEQRAAQELEDMRQDRGLRGTYAKWWVGICIAQLALMNVMLVCVGLGWLQFETGLFHAYLIGTFAECAGIVWVITRNLFPYRDRRQQTE